MRALLLSAYDAGSHRYWRRGLRTMLEDWQWRELTLPPRHFSWRVRGSPLYWALRERETLQQASDVLVATSMVDLATLRGLLPGLARVPTLLYFHENQFAYPVGRGRHSLLEAQMVSLYSALAADRIAFNTAYNRDSFLAGVETLLRKLPDFAPRETPVLLAARSEVLPVPLLPPPSLAGAHSPWRDRRCRSRRRVRIVWVGRFEYDKGGERLAAALVHLERAGVAYELALVGQVFREMPPVFRRIEQRFADRIVHLGWVPAVADYQCLLANADIVLSTALHEFQGVAVMEAVAQGCLPVLPARLAYPERYPAHYLYPSTPDDPEREGRAAADKLLAVAGRWRSGDAKPPSVAALATVALAPRYRALLDALAGGSPPGAGASRGGAAG